MFEYHVIIGVVVGAGDMWTRRCAASTAMARTLDMWFAEPSDSIDSGCDEATVQGSIGDRTCRAVDKTRPILVP